MDIEEAVGDSPIIIPEWKDYIPLKKTIPNFNFVGPIINQHLEGYDLEFEEMVEDRADGKTTIYLSFGGTGMDGRKLQETVGQLNSRGYFTIVSMGAAGEAFSIESGNGIVRNFMPGLSAARVSDVMVTHGSQGTVNHAIITGTPIVCLPINVDQGFHSYKAEEYGMGINVHKLNSKLDFFKLGKKDWLYRRGLSIPTPKQLMPSKR